MAMVVKNNIAAQLALGELNKNTVGLDKSLQKISSGMRINGAKDDASGFAISEKMRVQLRGLEQDFRNTQSGQSLLKVAEGAVDSTVNILRTLKEKALDSANDSNTDEDRAIMQKELEQYVDQVDQNALVTYNGMYLFDGQTGIHCQGVQDMIVSALYTEWIENTLDLIQQSYGISFWTDEMGTREITMDFVNDASSEALAWVTPTSVDADGRTDGLELTVNMHYFEDMDISDTSNVNGRSPLGGNAVLDRTIAHELTHAVMAAAIPDAVTEFRGDKLAVMEGLAELVHGIDDQRIIIGKDPVGDPYAGGYALFRYMAHQSGNDIGCIQKFMKVLVNSGATALDDAVSYASNGRFSDWADLLAKFAADAPTTDEDTLLEYCGIDLSNNDTGAIIGYDAGTCRREIDGDDIVPEGGSTTFWYAPESMSSIINNLTVHWTTDYGGQVGNKVLQIGTKANQAIKFGFHDMRAKALGLKSEDGTKVSVATQYDANNAIRLLDQSLKKALNEQTTIGALQGRLEHTVNNLVTASENIQRSDSAIRDADMAKEMAEYMKNNVLTQSAQSMLSQANQNLSSVLSLLQ